MTVLAGSSRRGLGRWIGWGEVKDPDNSPTVPPLAAVGVD
jgi:hypothetical protein